LKKGGDADMDDIPFGTGGGSENSMLEQRVAALETKVGQIETKVDRIDGALLRLEPAIREIAGKLSDLNGKVAGMDGRLLGIEGRLSQIPNFWQSTAIAGALLIGLSGVIFTTAKFLRP
jgi:uncharacterized coiled-coil protein SlyX